MDGRQAAVSKLCRSLAGAQTPVLVDFYATWWWPLQMMAGILNDVNSQLKASSKSLRLTPINTHRCSQHQVAALPTLVLFKAGQP
jgi:thioredoxin-like negative regulator of GroEL